MKIENNFNFSFTQYNYTYPVYIKYNKKEKVDKSFEEVLKEALERK